MTIHFLLTPDKSSSLALKRRVAEQCARMDVVVGTWPELLTQARNSHILPLAKDAWQEKLAAAAKSMDNVFWADSLRNVPSEAESIISIVGQHLTMLLESLGPDLHLSSLPTEEMQGRLLKRWQDFSELHAAMDAVLPPELAAIRSIIAAAPERRLRPVHIYHLDNWPRLNPWQRALVDHLNSLADEEDPTLNKLLHDVVVSPTASETSALRFMQENIFSLPSQKTQRDTTLQWLLVRDHLQEIEICASIVQNIFQEENDSLKLSDIALLIPNDDLYAATAHAVFTSAGIPLSDPGYECNLRDLGAETVLNLLLNLKKPAPMLAMASLLTSPLMPWDTATGNVLAQKVIKGSFQLTPPSNASDATHKMLECFRNSVSSAKSLKNIFSTFTKYLNNDKKLIVHLKRAQQLCAELSAFIGAENEVPWDKLIAKITMLPVQAETSKGVYQNGIALFREGCEPWRKVQRLFVLGCCEGHYPSETAPSSVFSESELIKLNAAGLDIETMKDRNQRQRDVFKRQIGSASDQATFFVPRRDSLGKVLSPSASLTFAAALFSDVDDEEALCLELETSEGRKQARGLPTGKLIIPEEPLPPPTELRFDNINLLQNSDGTMKVESPSRLETLMVAPLAWLFERLDIKAREWEPEKLDIMAKGTLAHDVFEHLFKPGKPIPPASVIESEVHELLEKAIQKRKIFLMNDEWKVERAHLEKDILKAALRWGEVLREIGAEVIATEVSLMGRLDDIPIHGNADLLLKLRDDQLLVVDYKKSSNKGRRVRMTEGYDHQAELYRMMIKTGGLEPKKDHDPPPELKETLELFKNVGEIGTLYYLMNDRTVLADTKGWIAKSVAGAEEVNADTSVMAMKLLRERIRELSNGFIDLQLKESEKDLKGKRGLGVYALDSSPLVRMFVKEPPPKETHE